MSINDVNGTGKNSEVVLTPFHKSLVQQIRAQDSYGFYQESANELILKPYIVTKQKKQGKFP